MSTDQRIVSLILFFTGPIFFFWLVLICQKSSSHFIIVHYFFQKLRPCFLLTSNRLVAAIYSDYPLSWHVFFVNSFYFVQTYNSMIFVSVKDRFWNWSSAHFIALPCPVHSKMTLTSRICTFWLFRKKWQYIYVNQLNLFRFCRTRCWP